MRVAVLGGSGFLGSHVADRLSGDGHDVIILDRRVSPWLRPDQEMRVGDITDYEMVLGVARESEVVFNFAAIADIDEARRDPIASATVNVMGNINALQASVEANCTRYVLASSLYVYSDAGSFYRCSKQAAESYVEEYSRQFDMPFTILRYGSLYGPRSDDKNGLRQVVRRAVESGELSYFGDPSATREYIHVDDAAIASVLALGDEFTNKQVILSGHQPMRVGDLLEMLAEILGLDPGSIKFHNVEDPGHYVRTPYAHRSNVAKKFTPSLFVDLGQGLVELIREIEDEIGISAR